ncbi:MAG: amidase [Candidatus Hodarchaeales archaeon]|jgi:fatty acid amide hydrolase
MTSSSDSFKSIINLSASEMAQKIREQELSSEEVVEAHIKRIKEVDKQLNSVVIPLFDEARKQAIEADKTLQEGKPVGPLHGVPVTIKEQYNVIGTETNVGVPSQRGRIVNQEGPLITRLREAGAIILGKTNIMMTLAGWESDNPVYGRTNNPWNLNRTPGGSSGGESAIIAAKGSPLGLGGDFAGSIRVPAHFCGLHGLKPTSGRLTNADNDFSLFSSGQETVLAQPGPLARSVNDLKLMMEVFTTPLMTNTPDLVPPVPWLDPDSIKINNLTVGVYTDNGVFPVSPAIKRAIEEASAALQAKGATIKQFSFPEEDIGWLLFLGVNAAGGNESLPRTLRGSKPNHLLKDFLRGFSLPGPIRQFISWSMERNGKKRLATVVRELKQLSAEEYWKLIEKRNNFRNTFLQALDNAEIDVLLCPPYATAAPLHGATADLLPAAGSYCILFNVLGMPAGVVSLTCIKEGEEVNNSRQYSKDSSDLTALEVEKNSVGLPVAVQVAARHWREDIVLKVMEDLEDHFKNQPSYPLNQDLILL